MSHFRVASLATALILLLLVRVANAENEKSPAMAVTLSLASTLVPMAVGITMAATADSSSGQVLAGACIASVGAIVGPAMGRLYAGDSSSSSGMDIRIAGTGACIAGLFVMSEVNESEENKGLWVAGLGLAGAGTVLILGSLIDDVGKASAAAQRTQKPSWQSRIEARPAYFLRDQAVGGRLSLSF